MHCPRRICQRQQHMWGLCTLSKAVIRATHFFSCYRQCWTYAMSFCTTLLHNIIPTPGPSAQAETLVRSMTQLNVMALCRFLGRISALVCTWPSDVAECAFPACLHPLASAILYSVYTSVGGLAPGGATWSPSPTVITHYVTHTL